jgi:HSP20 family molecular chaperone IbpA
MEQPQPRGAEKQKPKLKPLAITTSSDIDVNLYLAGNYGNLKEQQLVLEISVPGAQKIQPLFYPDYAVIQVEKIPRNYKNRDFKVKSIEREPIQKIIPMPVDVTAMKPASIIHTYCTIIYRWNVGSAIKQPDVESLATDIIKIDEDIYVEGKNLVIELAIPGVTEMTVDLKKGFGTRQLLSVTAKRDISLSQPKESYSFKTYYVKTYGKDGLTKMISLPVAVQEGEMKITKNNRCIVTIKMPLAQE